MGASAICGLCVSFSCRELEASQPLWLLVASKEAFPCVIQPGFQKGRLSFLFRRKSDGLALGGGENEKH